MFRRDRREDGTPEYHRPPARDESSGLLMDAERFLRLRRDAWAGFLQSYLDMAADLNRDIERMPPRATHRAALIRARQRVLDKAAHYARQLAE